MRGYTSLEQSKKLAEFLPLESADMEYMFLKEDGTKVSNIPFVKDDEEPEWPNDSAYDFIPCWSLAALLDILPNGTDICRSIVGRYYVHGFFSDNPVDACVAMIEKLHKLKML